MKTRTDILPEIERQVFRVITDADWKRELRAARARKNGVRARFQKILALHGAGPAQINPEKK